MSVARFAQVMNAADIHLDEACLAMSSAIQRPLDEIEWLAALDLLAAECPTPTADGVAELPVRRPRLSVATPAPTTTGGTRAWTG